MLMISWDDRFWREGIQMLIAYYTCKLLNAEICDKELPAIRTFV